MLLRSSCCVVEGRREVVEGRWEVVEGRREEVEGRWEEVVARHCRRSQLLALEQGWKVRPCPCIRGKPTSAYQRRSLSTRMCCGSHLLAGEASCELLNYPSKGV